ERHRGCEVQHGEIVEARLELPVAHRRVGPQAFLLGEAVDRSLLIADRVDEFELQPLPAGDPTPVGHTLQGRVVHLAADAHHGESLCTMTAFALDLPSFSSDSTRSWSLRMRPVIFTRAM